VPKFKTIEDEAKEIAEEIKEKVDQLVPEEVDITSLIPKKVDWDLKRNIEAKMEKLERITEKKINELIKMKIRDNTKPENADIKNEVFQDD
jgi:coiled-coil domain-containing protein 12